MKTIYSFTVNWKIEVPVNGTDTEENYEKAVQEAIKQLKRDFDEDYLEYEGSEEYKEEAA